MLTNRKVYEFVVQEVRTYNVQGDGRTRLEAEQDAIERFHKLRKSYEIAPADIGKPRIIKGVVRKLRG